MHTRFRAAATLLALVAAAFSLSSCDDASTPKVASPAPAASTSPSPTESTSPSATSVAANLLQVCDHAQDAFRSGDLGDAEQSRALASELQGILDVSEPDAAQVLRAMVAAAAAIAADGKAHARPALQRAEDRAFSKLQAVCVQAGSRAWSGQGKPRAAPLAVGM